MLEVGAQPDGGLHHTDGAPAGLVHAHPPLRHLPLRTALAGGCGGGGGGGGDPLHGCERGGGRGAGKEAGGKVGGGGCWRRGEGAAGVVLWGGCVFFSGGVVGFLSCSATLYEAVACTPVS